MQHPDFIFCPDSFWPSGRPCPQVRGTVVPCKSPMLVGPFLVLEKVPGLWPWPGVGGWRSRGEGSRRRKGCRDDLENRDRMKPLPLA